jgi:hypothetical protein
MSALPVSAPSCSVIAYAPALVAASRSPSGPCQARARRAPAPVRDGLRHHRRLDPALRLKAEKFTVTPRSSPLLPRGASQGTLAWDAGQIPDRISPTMAPRTTDSPARELTVDAARGDWLRTAGH